MAELRKAVAAVVMGVVGLIGLCLPASAAADAPCAPITGRNAITVLPILGPSPAKSGGQTYCQSAYGWTNSWFPTGQPKDFNLRLDVFSGDDAPSVSYTTMKDAVVGSGNKYNFIGPWLDGGGRTASFIGTNWKVTSDIAVKDNQGTSALLLPVTGGAPGDGLALQIQTTVAKTGVTQKFVFTNKTGASIKDLLFDDYFNFHPDGSLSGGAKCGVTTFSKLTATATITGTNKGESCTEIVSSGSLVGSINGKTAMPVKWDLGLATTVLNDISMGKYNMGTGPFMGDGAIDMVWNLGEVGVEGEASISITKSFSPVPEPSSFTLLGAGVLGLGLLGLMRRRSPLS
jgi:hypothetical protein